LGNVQVGGEFFLQRGELREGVSLVFEGRPCRNPKKAVQMELDV
jgi:hypothetical protein